MSRLPYPDLEELRHKNVEGALNAVRMTAHLPDDLFAGWCSLSAAMLKDETFDPELRELAIIRLAYLYDSSYELYYHSRHARQLGIPQEKIDALRDPGSFSSAFDSREQTVIRFTEELIQSVRPSDEVLLALRQHLSLPQIFTLLVIVGKYMLLARLLEMGGVEIDEGGHFDPKALAAQMAVKA